MNRYYLHRKLKEFCNKVDARARTVFVDFDATFDKKQQRYLNIALEKGYAIQTEIRSN